MLYDYVLRNFTCDLFPIHSSVIFAKSSSWIFLGFWYVGQDDIPELYAKIQLYNIFFPFLTTYGLILLDYRSIECNASLQVVGLFLVVTMLVSLLDDHCSSVDWKSQRCGGTHSRSVGTLSSTSRHPYSICHVELFPVGNAVLLPVEGPFVVNTRWFLLEARFLTNRLTQTIIQFGSVLRNCHVFNVFLED